MDLKFSFLLPTYNRPDKIKSLLVFLNSELSLSEIYFNSVEVLVSDNSTNDNTRQVCNQSSLKEKGVLRYFKNKSNIGLIGNILKLISYSKGEYSWILGDDDVYHSGVLTEILNGVRVERPSYIFLNHRAYIKNRFDKSGFKSAIDFKINDVHTNGKNLIFHIWNYSQTSLMFISCSVFKTELLKECVESDNKIDITFPLKMAFFCAARGKCLVIKNIYIDNIWGSTSWKNISDKVFNYYVPRHLYLLPKMGYNYLYSRKILIKYLISRLSNRVSSIKSKFFREH